MSDKTLKPIITQIPAYRTPDGKQFFNLDEAREYARTRQLTAYVADLNRRDPKFAKLDEDLFIEALKQISVRCAAVMQHPLTPTLEPRAPHPLEAPYAADTAIPAADPYGEVGRVLANARPGKLQVVMDMADELAAREPEVSTEEMARILRG